MKTIHDVAVIGAGAAGLMTAIECRRLGLSVLLVDAKSKIGAKILMSGGTRCNVTNLKVTERDYESENIRFVRNVLRAFPSSRAIEFFKTLGVEVVLEEGGKYFPSTHSGRTVLEAFLKEIQRTGVSLEAGRKVTRLDFSSGVFQIGGSDFGFEARCVIVCTGGLSFPATGSDGTGYLLASAFGHSMVSTSPSLTPLKTSDEDFKKLSGLTLPVRLTLWRADRKAASYEGSFLFTHFGFSGPVVLNISRHWIKKRHEKQVEMRTCFVPSVTEEQFREKMLDGCRRHPKRAVRGFLWTMIPERLAEVLLMKSGLGSSVLFGQLRVEDRERLIKTVFHFPLPVNGDMGYAKAEVTAGGIEFSEVDYRTMESQRQAGLFFAGEILDVDGRIGGFNFQWAWSSAVVAAQGAAKRLRDASEPGNSVGPGNAMPL